MDTLKRAYSSELLRGSFFVFLAGNLTSLGNFLYNLAMGRLLSPASYGDLGATLSLAAILAVPMGVVSLVIVKVVSTSTDEQKKEMLGGFWKYLTARGVLIAVLIGMIVISSSNFLRQYLSLSSVVPIYFVAAYLMVAIPSTINRAFLQGVLRFPLLAVNGVGEVVVKLVLGVGLVVSNFQLFGALSGPLLGILFGIVLSFLELKFILGGGKGLQSSPHFRRLFTKGLWPALLVTLIISLFMNTDMIMVHRFFKAEVAGGYVALATLGKIGFYLVGPVTAVMFPLISRRASGGEAYVLPLVGTLFLTLFGGLLLTVGYFLFPQLIIGLVFSGRYLEVSPFLGMFAFFSTIYGLNSVLSYFLLSVSEYKVIPVLFLISLSSFGLMVLFHQTIGQVIAVNIIVSLGYLVVALGTAIWLERVNLKKLGNKLWLKQAESINFP